MRSTGAKDNELLVAAVALAGSMICVSLFLQFTVHDELQEQAAASQFVFQLPKEVKSTPVRPQVENEPSGHVLVEIRHPQNEASCGADNTTLSFWEAWDRYEADSMSRNIHIDGQIHTLPTTKLLRDGFLRRNGGHLVTLSLDGIQPGQHNITVSLRISKGLEDIGQAKDSITFRVTAPTRAPTPSPPPAPSSKHALSDAPTLMERANYLDALERSLGSWNLDSSEREQREIELAKENFPPLTAPPQDEK